MGTLVSYLDWDQMGKEPQKIEPCWTISMTVKVNPQSGVEYFAQISEEHSECDITSCSAL